MGENIIEIRNLKKYFPIRKGIFSKNIVYIKAVDDVSFDIKKGTTFGLVGESGCGKSTIGRTVLRLNGDAKGSVLFEGEELLCLKKRELKQIRPHMQMIFQDPYSSLNPKLTIGTILEEGIKCYRYTSKKEIRSYVLEVMKKCGLKEEYIDRYPHEFSGGQRQRICIARAIMLRPKFVVADEPVSALDVLIRGQIVKLLKEIQKEYDMTYLFISHDLSVVEHISDDVGVMYLGSLVEKAPKEELFKDPMHPYTKALLSAIPVPDPEIKKERIILKGEIPSPSNPPQGCKFHTRCSACMEVCKTKQPIYKEYKKEHFVACHLYK